MTLEAIFAEVGRYPSSRHVVVTGGEPMIFPHVVELTKGLRARGLHVTIETAGTVYAPVACDLMSISPKLANSTPAGDWRERHEATRIQPEVLLKLMAEYEHQLKFVVAASGDLEEVRALIETLRADRARVVLMAEGTDAETLRERSRWLAEICKQEGFRFSPRLHVDLWGNRRGV